MLKFLARVATAVILIPFSVFTFENVGKIMPGYEVRPSFFYGPLAFAAFFYWMGYTDGSAQ